MLLFHVCVEAPYQCSFVLLGLACNRLSHLVAELVHSFFAIDINQDSHVFEFSFHLATACSDH
jgi:hypothetical protein